MKAEYGGEITWTSWPGITLRNVKREEIGICGITYERALRKRSGGHVRALRGTCFRCPLVSRPVTELYLRTNCLEVATKLEHYHQAVWRRQPWEELPDWIPTPEIPARGHRLGYVDAFTLLGDAIHPTYGHPKTLARAYDQVYNEGRENRKISP